jgi:hypothetical protein
MDLATFMELCAERGQRLALLEFGKDLARTDPKAFRELARVLRHGLKDRSLTGSKTVRDAKASKN